MALPTSRRCLYCDRVLASGPPEAPGRGFRLAYDPGKGRLWEVCPSCSRWNLVPMEERWETLEACEEAVRSRGRVVLSTPNLALVDVGEGELLRVGPAPRVEYAVWRYGDRIPRFLGRRGFLRSLLAGLPDPPVPGYSPYHLRGSGVPPQWVASPFVERASSLTYLFTHLPLAPACPACGRPLAIRPWDFQRLRLREGDEGLQVESVCALCDEGVHVPLREARPSLRLALALVTESRLPERRVREAAGPLAGEGGSRAFLERLARVSAAVGELAEARRASLLMALDDAAEAEALEAEWRRAEEIAAIVDGELTEVPGFQEFRRRILEDGEG